MTLLPVTAHADKPKVKALRPSTSLSSGYYILRPRCAGNNALSISGFSKVKYAVALSKKYVKSPGQIFYISRNSDGTYKIKNKKSGMVLGIKGISTKSGATVRQSTDRDSNFQKWYISRYNCSSGSYYMIQSAISDNMLTLWGGSDAENTRVYIHTYHYGLKKEHWSLVKVGGALASKYKTSSKTGMSSDDYKVLNNIIGAVETGGQIYGNRAYGDYTAPYTNTSNEHTCTLGWGAFYGDEAQYLVSQIRKAIPTTFKKIDSKGLIAAALKKNWVSSRWRPNASEIAVLKKLIVTKAGKRIQDQMFSSLMKQFVSSCTSEYTNNTWAIMMYCQIRHLGGKSGADRIFRRCKAKGSYTLDTIMWALQQDQSDSSSSYQVGDTIFWSRHEKCCEFIQKYAA